ncbi:MAG: hypothetical protein U1E51_26300 [Candidatus Binatia bacterium]|nr:hypothetical protein [Candidatus Binatia bacterium]
MLGFTHSPSSTWEKIGVDMNPLIANCCQAMQVQIHATTLPKLLLMMEKEERSGAWIVNRLIAAAKVEEPKHGQKSDGAVQEVPVDGGGASRALRGNQKVRRAGPRDVAGIRAHIEAVEEVPGKITVRSTDIRR